MGIRPSLKLCMAITDFERDDDGTITDSRWTLPQDAFHRLQGEFIEEYDDEFGISEVVAVIISELPYAHDVLYALAEVEEDGYRSRFQELPLVEPEKDYSELARAWIMVNGEGGREYMEEQGDWGKRQLAQAATYQQMLDRGHNYGQFRMSFNAWLAWAMYVFRDILKMDVEPGMVRLGLYWKWS